MIGFRRLQSDDPNLRNVYTTGRIVELIGLLCNEYISDTLPRTSDKYAPRHLYLYARINMNIETKWR
jgi:hypothetical protein